ncbi:hypothetical protein, partial [Pseudomonas sp. RTB2]|uniref:hypothetical protein n=1 Tax=Pseudomonas sp. RTB2 TaxID=3048632 RepID=UPI002B22CF8E
NCFKRFGIFRVFFLGVFIGLINRGFSTCGPPGLLNAKRFLFGFGVVIGVGEWWVFGVVFFSNLVFAALAKLGLVGLGIFFGVMYG